MGYPGRLRVVEETLSWLIRRKNERRNTRRIVTKNETPSLRKRFYEYEKKRKIFTTQEHLFSHYEEKILFTQDLRKKEKVEKRERDINYSRRT